MAVNKSMIQLMEEAVEQIDKLNAFKEVLVYHIRAQKKQGGTDYKDEYVYDEDTKKYGSEKGKTIYYKTINKRGRDDTKPMPKESFTESTEVNSMVNKIKSYLSKLGKEWDTKDFVVTKINNEKIEIRTDGTMYELIYDPYPSRREYDKFQDFMEENDWDTEKQGGGIIIIQGRRKEGKHNASNQRLQR